MTSLHDLMTDAAGRAADHRDHGASRPVFPEAVDLDKIRAALGSLNDAPTPPAVVIEELADIIEPALVTTTGPR